MLMPETGTGKVRETKARAGQRQPEVKAELLRTQPHVLRFQLKKNPTYIIPVSYTHLDVYKRQVLGLHKICLHV